MTTLSLLLLAAGCIDVATAQAMYRMTEIGDDNTQATALSAAGQVTGYADFPSGSDAFLWKRSGTHMRDLGAFSAYGSYGVAINKSGQVTGYSFLPPAGTYEHAFLWRNDGTPMVDLARSPAATVKALESMPRGR